MNKNIDAQLARWLSFRVSELTKLIADIESNSSVLTKEELRSNNFYISILTRKKAYSDVLSKMMELSAS